MGEDIGTAIVKHVSGKFKYKNNAVLPSPSASKCLVTKSNVNSYKSWSKRIHYVKIAER